MVVLVDTNGTYCRWSLMEKGTGDRHGTIDLLQALLKLFSVHGYVLLLAFFVVCIHSFGWTSLSEAWMRLSHCTYLHLLATLQLAHQQSAHT
jgi:hypothetical protein